MQMKKRYQISGFLDYKGKIEPLVITRTGFNGLLVKVMLVLMSVLVVLLAGVFDVQAQTVYYVRAGASGIKNGSDWNNAFTTLPVTLVRGATYYVADGNYAAYTFGDAVFGTSVITIKKATASSHGTDTGWSSSYGDGQAVFADYIAFNTSYYVFDGNGTHTIPSKTSSDYGFKVVQTSSTDYSGVIRIGDEIPVSNITIKYTHAYNTYGGKQGNYNTMSVRFYPTASHRYVKLQYCFLENSGKDGIQISASSYLLFERNYIYGLGLFYSPPPLPDYHGQTVQIFYGGSNIIFRNNIWEACEGQSLIALGSSAVNENIRFYGNVVFVGYGQKTITAGFNSSGGIIGDAWGPRTGNLHNEVIGMYVYNNTLVNIGGEYDRYSNTCRWIMQPENTNTYSYNNLFYNCHDTLYTGWVGYGYHASGGGSTAGGTKEQTGLTSGIFQNYTGNDFRLASPTQAGLALTSQSWWSGGPHSFFGTIDSAVDMYGNTRGADGTWDRGAYEYGKGVGLLAPTLRRTN